MQSGKTVYIRIYENRIHVRNVDDRNEIELTDSFPFTTERLLVGNFTVAQTIVKKGLKIVMGKQFFPPVIVMHPMEKVEGGLSQVEERVLKDLAIITGAQKVVVWIGHELNDDEVLSKAQQAQ